jgi:hypothetical protein
MQFSGSNDAELVLIIRELHSRAFFGVKGCNFAWTLHVYGMYYPLDR